MITYLEKMPASEQEKVGELETAREGMKASV